MEGPNDQQDYQFAQCLAKKYLRLTDGKPTDQWDLPSLVSLIRDVRANYFHNLSGKMRQEAITKYVQIVCGDIYESVGFLKKIEPFYSVHYFHQNIIAIYKDWKNILGLGKQFPRLVSPCLSSNFVKFLSDLEPAERHYICELGNRFYPLIRRFGFNKFVFAFHTPIIVQGDCIISDLISNPTTTDFLLEKACAALAALALEEDTGSDNGSGSEEDGKKPLDLASLLTQVASPENKIL